MEQASTNWLATSAVTIQCTIHRENTYIDSNISNSDALISQTLWKPGTSTDSECGQCIMWVESVFSNKHAITLTSY